MALRTLFAFLSLLFVFSCGVKDMNNTMQHSNQLVQKNIDVMQASTSAIQSNTDGVGDTNLTLKVFAIAFPIAILFFVLLLFYPAYKLIKEQHKILKEIKHLEHKRKRR